MKIVYEATNVTDAHVVSNLLEQEGIDSRVLGENIGVYGHALGSVQVVVPEERESAARKIIGEWESARPREEPGTTVPARPQPSAWSPGTVTLLIGLALLLAVLWYFTGL